MDFMDAAALTAAAFAFGVRVFPTVLLAAVDLADAQSIMSRCNNGRGLGIRVWI